MRRQISIRALAAVAAMALSALPLQGCSLSGASYPPVTRSEILLDTVCTISIYADSKGAYLSATSGSDSVSSSAAGVSSGTDSAAAAAIVLGKCFDRIKQIDGEMNAHNSASEVSAVNSASGKSSVKVSEDTFRVVSAGIEYSKLTEGKFDISVGPLVSLWGINTPGESVPSASEIKSVLPLIDYRKIILNSTEKTVFLKDSGMALDLGGIAKGFSGDAVAEILRESGVGHALVDLGGNIVAVGNKPDGSDWKVAVKDPFGTSQNYFGVLEVSDKAVVTSGVYERYFENNGKIYHHIMDTSTGYPVDNGLLSVTIIHDSSMDADALAKAFTFGLEKGLAFISSQKGADAVFVTDKKEVYITPGLKSTFKITDSEYKLKN
ncbi:MAG: FAD:protein FMN transferase [Clostridiales bacterium]|nr:FAD:protein FMN transferase [Clostridiales bacterium]